ncbi:Phage head-tail joining protein [Xaviernesmea oryzae]|uniref:Phage head-tail joining protein n=1 Tax=Xaviernesmea oryzae TaxID=464029 RepID=A0A1X7FKB2_9HYPH|nr:head-tail adaptor protein [Xaviernesmea oryzae]SMF53267.1 Phage head-tail joining protein [Xaviernesmea oryzae]
MARTPRKGAGSLRARLNFQKRGDSDDGMGTVIPGVGPYATVFTDAVELIPRMGSEAVMASRLQGVQPYTARVRASSWTRQVTPAWRAVDARNGAVYAIVSPFVDLDQKGAYLEGLLTVGGQTAG